MSPTVRPSATSAWIPAFIDYLTTSTAANNVPGAVVTRPDYVNNVEGTITQTDNTLGLAIAGQGFFAVSKQAGMANNLPTFRHSRNTPAPATSRWTRTVTW